MPHRITLYTDGGARGNPGDAGIGIYIEDQTTGKKLGFGKYIGKTTNNQAEYRALLFALEKSAELGGEEVLCYLDSELVVKQMKREYRVKDAGLAPLFLKAWNRSQAFKKISFTHISRGKNKIADSLVNRAIDERGAVSCEF